MPKLVILGSAHAVPDRDHENTHMALEHEGSFILIDSVGTPVVRLRQAGLDILQMSDMILTHFHPDHVSGVPNLLMSSWLLGRKAPLNVYGLAHTLERIEMLMQAYEWETWPNFFDVNFVQLSEEEGTLVLENEWVRMLASPVDHLIPTIGLRMEMKVSGKVLAYSCDTEPSPKVARLASGSDILIHEATGAWLGHSSAAQAGATAQQAEVGELYLIHYAPGEEKGRELRREAQTTFAGAVRLAQDFMEIEL